MHCHLAAICSAVAMVLAGCGGGGGETTSAPEPGPSPGPSPIPELSVPHCDDGKAVASPYFVSDAVDTEAPLESSETTLCWNDNGIEIFTNHTDLDIWQTCEQCGCAVWDHGDVTEVMLGPVSSLDKVATYYLEMNVGAVHNAFWGGYVNNSQGDDQMYVADKECNADALSWGHFHSCEMNCTTGPMPQHTIQSGDSWWSRSMTVPWTLFKAEFRPKGGQPYQYWRGDFFRFSHPHKNSDGNGYNHSRPEKTGWVPTHDFWFHIPARFGKFTMKAKVSADSAVYHI